MEVLIMNHDRINIFTEDKTSCTNHLLITFHFIYLIHLIFSHFLDQYQIYYFYFLILDFIFFIPKLTFYNS